MKKLLALVIALAVSSVFADETANLLTNTWSGAVNYTGTGGGYSGGGAGGLYGNYSSSYANLNGGGGGSFGITTPIDNGAINTGDGSVTITLI